MASLPTGLLDSVKNYLDNTWTDTATDLKLTGIIERGMKYINGASGATNDYTIEDKPKELLLKYCMYARSNALSEFQKNYLSILLYFFSRAPLLKRLKNFAGSVETGSYPPAPP
jgi:hypothetical protein